MKPSRKFVTIIIPVFNEIKTIDLIVKKVLNLDIPKEVILVDDGSTDGTSNKIDNYRSKCIILRHKNNHGKGAAFLTALRRSKGEYIIIQDADLELEPNDISKILKYAEINNSQAIIGSRCLKPKFINPYTINDSGNHFMGKIVSFIAGYKITDPQSCYCLVKTEILKKLNLESKGFDINAEIIAKLIKSKIRLHEVSVSYRKRFKKDGKKIRWIDGIHSFYKFIYFYLSYKPK
jgi:dolichol-phosphate mannosyltransferase